MIGHQDELDLDTKSAGTDEPTRSKLELISHDWRADDDWRRFRHACVEASLNPEQTVDPNDVRRLLTNEYGLTIEPRRYSSFWSRARSPRGFLDAHGWTTNHDTTSGNAGKPLRTYRLRTYRLRDTPPDTAA